MLPSRRLRVVLFGLAVSCVVPSLSAVIVELRMYHGKQVQCIHSGLHSSDYSPSGKTGNDSQLSCRELCAVRPCKHQQMARRYGRETDRGRP